MGTPHFLGQSVEWRYETNQKVKSGDADSVWWRPSKSACLSWLSPACRMPESLWKRIKKLDYLQILILILGYLYLYWQSLNFVNGVLQKCIIFHSIIPATSHLFPSLLLFWGCRQAGKFGSSCVCMSLTWFRIELHLATLSGPVIEDAAVQ